MGAIPGGRALLTEPEWTDSWYGDLYDESVADLLTPRLSELEAAAIRRLLGLGPADRVLDLACGHARHAHVLAPCVREVVGLDRNALYLTRARGGGAALVRGDLRALPFVEGAFDAAYSWYASLFVYDDPGNEGALREAARVVRPGGRLLVQHANPLQLAKRPVERAERDLPGGGRVAEVSHYDPGTGRDRLDRRLTRRDGTVLAGTAHLRYYTPQEWESLARRAGLRLLRIASTSQAETPPERFEEHAPDLIALVEKLE
jgi:SAM-dependent methyltransferase